MNEARGSSMASEQDSDSQRKSFSYWIGKILITVFVFVACTSLAVYTHLGLLGQMIATMSFILSALFIWTENRRHRLSDKFYMTLMVWIGSFFLGTMVEFGVPSVLWGINIGVVAPITAWAVGTLGTFCIWRVWGRYPQNTN